MPGHGSQGFRMSSALCDLLIESDHMTRGPVLLVPTDGMSRLEVGPLEIVIHIRTQAAEADLPPARVNARSRAGVSREVFRIGETVDIADLELNVSFRQACMT